jgi:hypothetical protein
MDLQEKPNKMHKVKSEHNNKTKCKLEDNQELVLVEIQAVTQERTCQEVLAPWQRAPTASTCTLVLEVKYPKEFQATFRVFHNRPVALRLYTRLIPSTNTEEETATSTTSMQSSDPRSWVALEEQEH